MLLKLQSDGCLYIQGEEWEIYLWFRSYVPKRSRYEIEEGRTKKGFSFPFQGAERLGMWQFTAYCFLAPKLTNVTIML